MQTTTDFRDNAPAHGVEVLAAESFSSDPRQQVQNLKVSFVIVFTSDRIHFVTDTDPASSKQVGYERVQPYCLLNSRYRTVIMIVVPGQRALQVYVDKEILL